jgi:hypothetical protein
MNTLSSLVFIALLHTSPFAIAPQSTDAAQRLTSYTTQQFVIPSRGKPRRLEGGGTR